MRAIAIDFETANEERASPCAIGLAWIENGSVTRREYSLVRPPELRFAPGNIRVHGIRPEDVAGAPELPEVIRSWMDELVAAPIVAHNAGFDIAVLCATLVRYRLPVPRLTYLCSKTIARRAWPDGPRFGLAALAARIGLSFTHHHAGEDAYACAAVTLAAARTAGTDRIGLAAERLGVRAGFVDGPLRTPCLADRPGQAPPPPRPVRPMARLAFTMRGSAGSLYEVVGSETRAGYRLGCSCKAGLHGRRCRHVTALLDGEVGDLVSDNTFDVEKLRVVVEAFGEAAIWPPERRREVTRSAA